MRRLVCGLFILAHTCRAIGAEPWDIQYPSNDSVQPYDQTLSVQGIGVESTTYVIEVDVDDMLRKTHASQTGPQGGIYDNVPLPSNPSVWTEELGNTDADVWIMVDEYAESHRSFYFYRSGGAA